MFWKKIGPVAFLFFLQIGNSFTYPHVSKTSKLVQWNTHKVTWSLNPFSKYAFAKMPLTRQEAETASFTQLENADSECNGTFQGFRYIYNNDPAIIMLYDVNGYIAGTQTGFAEHSIPKRILHWFKQSSIFTVEDINSNGVQMKLYTLTAYLSNPETICTTGRTQEEFEKEPGGTDLYLKNGSNVYLIPRNESDLQGTAWVKGRCFPSMGYHYFYNMTGDMDCDYLQPVFLLYNRKQLTGFGWGVLGSFPSRRFEHVPPVVFPMEAKSVPSCLYKRLLDVGSATFHHYMSDNLRDLICI